MIALLHIANTSNHWIDLLNFSFKFSIYYIWIGCCLHNHNDYRLVWSMALLLVLLVSLSVNYECACTCVSKYTEIEKKFLSNEENIEKLQDIFFPVNGKSTNFAVVNYFYYKSPGTPVVCSYSQMHDSHQLYQFAHKFEEHCFQPSDDGNSFCHWLWTNCAIFVLYSPRDLQILAYTINMLFPQVRTNLTSTVSLEVENICENVTYNHLLKLTARVCTCMSLHTLQNLC